MNVHVSYRLHKIPAVEKDIQHQIEKLQKRLQVFRPELVHLKGVVEEISAREGTSVSLNLRLPSGQMAVQSSAPTAAAAVKGVCALEAIGTRVRHPSASIIEATLKICLISSFPLFFFKEVCIALHQMLALGIISSFRQGSMESLKGPLTQYSKFSFLRFPERRYALGMSSFRSSHETGWVSSEGKQVRGECKKSGLLKPNRLATHPRSSTGFHPGTQRTLLQYGVFCMLY